MSLQNSNTYCPLPWAHRYVTTHGNALPCCAFKSKNKSPDFQAIKHSMLDGKEVDGCRSCYSNEKAGVHSLRQSSIEKYGTPEEVVSSLEISFDNICNFKCRSCSSLYSHLIREDEIKILGLPLTEKKYLSHNYHDKIDYENLKKFAAHGGEPLLSPKFKAFCNRMLLHDSITELCATITTNGSIVPQDDIYDFIISVKDLRINISIDGYGKLNEYIRRLSDWELITKNLNFFNELISVRGNKETHINVHTTVSCYNINKLQDLDNFIETMFPKFTTSKACVQSPEMFSIRNFPKEYKNQLMPYLEKYPNIIKILQQEPTKSFDYVVYMHNKYEGLDQNSLEGKNDLLLDYLSNYSKINYNEEEAIQDHKSVVTIVRNKDW
jgi:hypothetical protein|tara:strand:- start:737 stop:1879 length:1143 start_codon:yes stop_codon:yes gene_type:complete